jgi:uncharacterized repeat protein (TIGR01451 family)
MIPNQITLGTQTLTTTITANNLFVVSSSPSGNLNEAYLYQGAQQIPLWSVFSGVNATVNSTDSCTIQNATIPINAQTGLYNLVVKTQDAFGQVITQDTLPSAFTILPPDGYLQGTVYEDINLNGQRDGSEPGLDNFTITLQPAIQYFYSAVNGNFLIPVSNGVHTVTILNNYTNLMFLSSDSASYTVTMNNANIGGLNFGMRRGLTGLAPVQSVAGRTINFTATSRRLFNGTGTGNISFGYLQKFNQSYYYLTSINVVDSNTVNFSVNLPTNAPLGSYDLSIYLSSSSGYHILPSCFTVVPYDAFLQGNIYFDINQNGLKDTLEPGLPNERVNILPDSGAGFSSQNGDYSIAVLNGNHTVSWTPTPTSIFQLSSDSAAFSVNNTGTVTGLDFGLTTTNPDYTCDIQLTGGFPRCNSGVWYYLNYVNKSNIPFNGRVYLVKDPSSSYFYSTVTPSSFSGDTIFWNFIGLMPFTPSTIQVTLFIPGSGVLNYHAGMIAEDGSGAVQFTDLATLSQTIRCSFDPNDKSVTPEGVGQEHFTLMADWLEYLIRFQNTGTDTAFNVTIFDHLSNDLDLNSFELLGSSSPVSTEVRQNGEAIFTFANILLPDSNIDEPNSHGFVKYRIKMKQNVPDFTTVENTAFIVFDANAPIVTNTTTNLMVAMLPVGLSENVKLTGKAIVYPNPFSETALLLFNNPKQLSIRFELTDVTGKLLRSEKTNGEEFIIRKNNLTSGIYFYRLINPDDSVNATGKMILK